MPLEDQKVAFGVKMVKNEGVLTIFGRLFCTSKGVVVFLPLVGLRGLQRPTNGKNNLNIFKVIWL